MMTYQESLDWLFSTQLFGIKLGLEGPRRLLREAYAFPPAATKVIHVAGTNGKGSTCAMIDSVARARGIRTGLFTSPHLIDYRERIRVNGVDIPAAECAALLTALREVCERLTPHPTFFEITLALALKWFKKCACELIILETGMGGRLDATTAVPADVCALTPIAMDHTKWLGDTIPKIAAEKAGIFLEGVPAISTPQDPAARQVLEQIALERDTPLSFLDSPLLGYGIRLAGAHQAWNAALALETLHSMGIRLRDEVVRQGLATVYWPGRFESRKYETSKLVLDGAHNPHGAASLVATWREMFPDQKGTVIFGGVEGKNQHAMLEQLAEMAEEIHLCPVKSARGLSPAELEHELPPGVSSRTHASFAEALQAAVADPSRPVLITGSLFLVGEARAFLEHAAFRETRQ